MAGAPTGARRNGGMGGRGYAPSIRNGRNLIQDNQDTRKTCADIVIKLDELIEYVWLDPEIIHDILTALKTRGARAALFQFPRFRHTIEDGPFSGVPHVVEFLDSIKKDLIRVSGVIV